MALTDNLISFWNFEGNSNDSVASNNGTNTSISFSTGNGKIDQGISTTASAGCVSIPASSFGTLGTGDFSVSLWFNPASPTSAYPMVFGSFHESPPYAGPTIFFDPNGSSGVGGDGILFRVRSSNQVKVTSPSASSMYGTWQHIVFLRSSGTCKVYYNNSEVASFTDTSSIPAAQSAYLFSRDYGPQSQPTGAKGDIFGIWNKALTTTEISQLYNGGAGLQYPFGSSSQISSINGVALADISSFNGVAKASIASVIGVANS